LYNEHIIMLKKITSFGAVSVLALVMLASFSFMFAASRYDSAIDDELAHIPAGYGYVHNLDYRLNPEHPPLVKALAMLPVLFLNPNFPDTSSAWLNEVNSQWSMGAQFLYQSGNDATAIIRTARIMPIVLTLILIVFVYLLARKIMGDLWALLPAILFALDPTVLAHGHYVTTDVGAALGIVAATYYVLNYFERPSAKRMWIAGIAFGIAQAMKFSTPLLIPLFIFLVVVRWLYEVILAWNATDASRRWKTFAGKLGHALWKLILIGLIGYFIVIYPLYFLFTLHYPIAKQASDTAALLAGFGGKLKFLATLDMWMAKNPILRPFAQYLLGLLMVIQRAAGGNTIYFLGEVRNAGGPLYFPILFLLKEPIPTLIIVIGALLLGVWRVIRNAIARHDAAKERVLNYIGAHFAEFAMASFIVLYWGYSMKSTLNIGIRHLLPTFPFIYILAAGAVKQWITHITMPNLSMGLEGIMDSAKKIARSFVWRAVKYIFLIVLLFWLLLETSFTAPHFLSYFNEFAGGTAGGYHYVTDSNYDWGQDLLALKQWADAHPEAGAIAVDYFGGGNPHYYLGDKETDWQSSKGNPAAQGIHWIAISINQLEGATQPLAPDASRNPADSYAWLTALRPLAPGMGNVPSPDARAGTSIFIYHL